VRECSISDHPSGNGYARPEQISRGGRGQEKHWTLEDGKAGRNKRDVWEIATQPYPEAHFATYPEDLVIPCIKAGTPEGGVVLDPFAGSGTTLAVARRLGRRSIGIELNPAYVDLIKRRITKASLPLLEAIDPQTSLLDEASG
jgi:DNA modification methylase